ncbi:c-type cytochrome [Deinococcus petrolearius]|uniref:C-type cytochrome n=1 Tax=Deinococcus petrolearius TaxID=1751295 RepID=A0ABW1DNV7_9DEIO
MNGRKNRWTAGNVTSWLLGVTLGLIVGVVLLIVIPRTIPSDATPGPEGTAATPVNNEAAGAAGAAAATETAGNAAEGGAAGAGGDGESAGAASGTVGETAGAEAGTAQGDGNPGQGPTPSQPSTAVSPTQETGAAASGAASSGAPSESGASNAADGDAAAGQQVFAGNCAGCHGQNAQGGIGPSLVTADGPKAWTLAQFTTVLREGRTPERTLNATMPRFSAEQISDQQAADLQAYIKTLQ